MSRMRKLQRDGGARRTEEYVGFLNGWSDSGIVTVVQGQVVALGVRDGMSDGVEVWRQPCRRPESVVPAAMVELHRVVRWSFLTIVIPT